MIISSLIRGDRVRGLYSKWKSSIWTSISFNTRIIKPVVLGGGAAFSSSRCQWNGFRWGYKDVGDCVASSSSSSGLSSGVDSGGEVILEMDIDRSRGGLADCRPSRDCGGDVEANVKSARISLS